jgi:hypothetical protein
MLLEILRRGEVLPDNVDIQEELQKITTPASEPAEDSALSSDRVDQLIDLLSR